MELFRLTAGLANALVLDESVGLTTVLKVVGLQRTALPP
jgi:hypothetical protein